MFKEGELHMQQYPVRTIDLEALRENVRLLRSTLPEKTKLMAVVKADAYGHGIAKVAHAALEAGASTLSAKSALITPFRTSSRFSTGCSSMELEVRTAVSSFVRS